MKKVSTSAAAHSRNISRPKLTIGLDPGDRNNWYCVVDEAGQNKAQRPCSSHLPFALRLPSPDK
jgi:hypothetical protein